MWLKYSTLAEQSHIKDGMSPGDTAYYLLM